MSRRSLNTGSGSSNPAKKFIQWKSNDKNFSYFDKSKGEKGENVAIPLPFRFQFLEDFHTIKGWNDKTESGIYSNEVKYISKEELTVKAFKGGEIASGLYSDIRSKVRDAGGVYHRSVYIVLEDGEIANLSLKGSAVSEYSNFMDKDGGKIESYWIEVNGAEDKKKGATKYSTPIFSIGEAFSADELKTADDSYKIIVDYYKGYTEDKEVKEDPIDEDDLDF